MKHIENKASVIIELHLRGYDHDFILKDEYLICIQTMQLIYPDDFEIAETYRFDGTDSFCDMDVIYAIRSVYDGQKGIVMASDGTGLPKALLLKITEPLKFQTDIRER